MTIESYRLHLGDIICSVFAAEQSVNERLPWLKDHLKSGAITPYVYVDYIADEIISQIPQEELDKILEDGQ